MIQHRRTGLSKRTQAIIMLVAVVAGIAAGVYVYADQFLVNEVSTTPALESLAASTPIPPAEVADAAQVPLQPDGSPYPAVFIPAAGVSEYIIESRLEPSGWRVDHLGDRVGHLEGTAAVGDSGNIVLAGHIERSDGRPSVFASLGAVGTGRGGDALAGGVGASVYGF